MKNIFLIIGLLLISAAGAFAQTKSVYTSLSDKNCKTIVSNPDEGGDYRGLCPGTNGYKLELLEGDLRQSINVIAPNKKKYELNLWSVVSAQFSAVGEKAEWRVSGAGKNAKPAALIIRFNASENPENASITTSYLVVVKITKNSACVTNIVKPSANANVEARKSADSAADQPCLGN